MVLVWTAWSVGSFEPLSNFALISPVRLPLNSIQHSSSSVSIQHSALKERVHSKSSKKRKMLKFLLVLWLVGNFHAKEVAGELWNTVVECLQELKLALKAAKLCAAEHGAALAPCQEAKARSEAQAAACEKFTDRLDDAQTDRAAALIEKAHVYNP